MPEVLKHWSYNSFHFWCRLLHQKIAIKRLQWESLSKKQYHWHIKTFKINLNQPPQNDVLPQFCSLLSQPPAFPGHLPQILGTSSSETSHHSDGSGDSQLLSYLQCLLLSPCSNTQGCRPAITVSPRWPDSSLWVPPSHLSAGGACHSLRVEPGSSSIEFPDYQLTSLY